MYSYICARTVNDWQNTRDFWSLLSLSSSQSWLVLTFQQIRCEYLLESIIKASERRNYGFFALWIYEQCEIHSSYSYTTFCIYSLFLSLSLSLQIYVSLNSILRMKKLKWHRWHRQQQHFPLDNNLSTWINRR